jgi:hypothetical protein
MLGVGLFPLILRDGAVLSVVGSTGLLLMLRYNPRLFLGHYAKAIREVVPPRSARERWIAFGFGLLLAAPLGSALLWQAATLESHSFWDRFAYAFGVLFVFNLVDLVVLDWLIVCWFKLPWAVLPGTAHIAVPNPYVHHFKEFLMGTVGLAAIGLAIAAFLSIWR